MLLRSQFQINTLETKTVKNVSLSDLFEFQIYLWFQNQEWMKVALCSVSNSGNIHKFWGRRLEHDNWTSWLMRILYSKDITETRVSF